MTIDRKPGPHTHRQPETRAAQVRDVAGPSEEDIHREHRAALEATLFHEGGAAPSEVVLELERGSLRVRRGER